VCLDISTFKTTPGFIEINRSASIFKGFSELLDTRGSCRTFKISTKLLLIPGKPVPSFTELSLSEIRMNKNDIPSREDTVGLFLKCLNNFSLSLNFGIYVL